ncbi:MAG: hypothetical protein AAFR71_13685 [Pseudomonadota bacterium]
MESKYFEVDDGIVTQIMGRAPVSAIMAAVSGGYKDASFGPRSGLKERRIGVTARLFAGKME